ncbi:MULTISPECIES: hypothetical protein [Burkholderiaceae]|uniref:hypothetical protein n=1 Tax=Burkholderiaceae TaxID=119060 RepID=UPI00141FBEFB|nr:MULTISPECIES: hypothetical protein [Burkholderiaceae]MBN3850079.1 hypothetical protein [Paraburkholderia sp. Ac-20342]NIF51605.1 hypothetical protein [Burkholderia sp. Ax-1724]NIF80445.1 hypothetical protein [Paraburkholderia sp. Cy-641]
MSAASSGGFRGRDLELELLDANSEPLVRLFAHPGGDWDPPEEKYRNLRVDPPAGHKDAFAVLYTGNTLATVAIECHILAADAADRYLFAPEPSKSTRSAMKTRTD